MVVFPASASYWGVPFRSCNMVPSAKPVLFAFLQSMRSISLGRNLKAFILRCVLLWPRILRSLRKVWSSYFQTSSRDEKKTKGDSGGPSYPGTTRKREEYVVVCASQAYEGVRGPNRNSVLRSSNAEQSIQLEDGIPRNPSMPLPLSSSHAPPPQDPLWLSATTPPSGSPHTSVRSFRTDSSVGSANTPVRWTHSRATDGQFTGASSRSRSRPSSPFRRRPNTRPDLDISTPPTMTQDLQGPPEDSTSGVPTQLSPRNPSRPSSPFLRHFSRPNTPTSLDFDVSTPPTMTQDLQGPPEDSTSGVSTQLPPRNLSRPSSPFRRHFSRPNTPTSPGFDISTPPTMTQDSQGSSPGDSASGFSIQVEQPSRSASPETTESMQSTSRPRLPSLDGLAQSSLTSHQRPPTDSMNSSAVSSDLKGHSPSMSGGHIGAQDGKERIQDPLTSQPTQTAQITFPEPSSSRVLTKISTTNDVTKRTPSVPHSRSSSHAPSPQGSPKLPATPLPLGSPHTSASSFRAESPRLPPAHGRTPNRLTPYQLPFTEYMNSSAVSPHLRGHSPLMYGTHTSAHQSMGSFPDSMTIQSFQAPFSLPVTTFPEPSVHRLLTPALTTNASNSSFRPDTHPVRPMHSDQVSRYVKKGDV
jgi:hypothetical protein